MYKQAIENANNAGEGNKARRYGRGLKVLSMLCFSFSFTCTFHIQCYLLEVSNGIVASQKATDKM